MTVPVRAKLRGQSAPDSVRASEPSPSGGVEKRGPVLVSLSRRDEMKVAGQFIAWDGSEKGTVPAGRI
jgi:hypothetical protein